jgi:hypothetical protein
MSRSTAQPIQTPGEVAQEPAAEAQAPSAAPVEPEPADQAARIAELEAEIAKLKADPKLPQVVYEPETPHGKEKLAESATGGMTVAEVMQAIDDKRLPEPVTTYLCADGYYARRS